MSNDDELSCEDKASSLSSDYIPIEKRFLVQSGGKSKFFTLNSLIFNKKPSHYVYLVVKTQNEFKQLQIK